MAGASERPEHFAAGNVQEGDEEGMADGVGGFMIARIWHGRVPIARSAEYMRLMRTIALPDYKRIPGNRGAYALQRIEGNVAHVEMLTFWESKAAIAKFAGDEIEIAKYYDYDKDFLLELEPNVRHYEMWDE